ncbi:peptidase M48 Ste24p [Leptothrix cholodnii SP-6]|uniref:Peptidase M48 Ste24p n=1 Tax=Leptothrix cholodnii (strain ATCC 51168 / LMG 8142 / SP-6) TaxID=395495 RepID=B1XXZ8_LEPCP|nr:M48 family metalloprotease [Leptothrix cholodnii]ACB32767.1 peptidase M48 Ste24p [Leptothrix cholodnii SP-6]
MTLPLTRLSPPRRLRRAGWCLAAALLCPAPIAVLAQGASSTLPALGDAASDEIAVAAEGRLGDRIMQELRRDPDVLDDPLLVEYIERIWQPLLAAAKARGDVSEELAQNLAWQTFVVRDRSVNAFALPGGYVGVHLGLLSMTGSRDELASVLAHEMSHVSQRHIARMMTSGRRSSMLALATMILGIMAVSRSPDAAQALVMGGQAAAVQGQLNFSRDMEREADRVGFGVLQGAGYEGVGMVGMFERMQLAARLTDSNQFPYLRSHPLTSDRIAEARSRLGLDGAQTPSASLGSGGASAAWLHAAMQGRARALMDGRNEALQRLASAPGDASAGQGSAGNGTLGGPPALASAYAAALAASRLKQWPLADAALQRARDLAAPHEAAARAVAMLRIESLIERDRAVEALNILQAPGGARVDDGSRAGLMLVARVALAAHRSPGGPQAALQRSSEALMTWVTDHPNDASAWDLLAQLHERRGQPLAALRAQAEVRVALGDWQGAADRLRAGQRLARGQGQVDHVEAAVLDVRLKVVEQKRRQQALDEGRAPGDESGR